MAKSCMTVRKIFNLFSNVITVQTYRRVMLTWHATYLQLKFYGRGIGCLRAVKIEESAVSKLQKRTPAVNEKGIRDEKKL